MKLEGAIFYWSCWAFWIYLTFILEKQNPYRVKLAAIVLIALILSNFQFKIGEFEIQASGLFILGISYLFYKPGKTRSNHLLFYLFIYCINRLCNLPFI